MMKYKYLPAASQGETSQTDNSVRYSEKGRGKYPCPCCGNITLPVPQNEAIAYICHVCMWENDVFLKSDDEPSDENRGMTLRKARENYKKFGACEERFVIDNS